MGCSSARGLPGLFSTIWRELGYPTLRPAPGLFDRNGATSDADSKAAEGDDYSIDNPEQPPILLIQSLDTQTIGCGLDVSERGLLEFQSLEIVITF